MGYADYTLAGFEIIFTLVLVVFLLVFRKIYKIYQQFEFDPLVMRTMYIRVIVFCFVCVALIVLILNLRLNNHIVNLEFLIFGSFCCFSWCAPCPTGNVREGGCCAVRFDG